MMLQGLSTCCRRRSQLELVLNSQRLAFVRASCFNLVNKIFKLYYHLSYFVSYIFKNSRLLAKVYNFRVS